MNKIVKCPTCHTQVEWSQTSKFKPFCSERCQLIDLGEWASEKHAIADEPIPSTDESYNTQKTDSENSSY